MQDMIRGVLLMSFILLVACIRVQVDVPRPAEQETGTHQPGGNHQPPPEITPDSSRKKVPTRAAQPSNSIVLTQNTSASCIADEHATRAVAQETGAWCWAASAEGVLSFHSVNLPQCEAATKIKAGGATTTDGSPLCCKDKWNAQCQQNGWTDEVFDAYGIDYNWWHEPITQKAIIRQLCQNGPFPYSIEYRHGGGHTFVIKQYLDAVGEEGEISLLVDNHGYFLDTQGNRISAGFKEIPYWAYKEGWDGDRTNKVDFTYYLIKPARS